MPLDLRSIGPGVAADPLSRPAAGTRPLAVIGPGVFVRSRTSFAADRHTASFHLPGTPILCWHGSLQSSLSVVLQIRRLARRHMRWFCNLRTAQRLCDWVRKDVPVNQGCELAG